MKKIIILIGPLNSGNIACTGDTMKNQLFVRRFCEVYDKVITVDTYNWMKRPWCLINMIIKLILYPKAKVIVSANSDSACKLIKILDIFGITKKTFYWVVGGSFHKRLENGNLNIENYSQLKGIFVQSLYMEESMRELGLSNVKYVPNSKYIDYIPEKKQKSDTITHFVFLSRIEKEKGCDYIFNAIEILNKKGYKGKFDVTFYGRTTHNLKYSESFMKSINKYNANYNGVLNLQQSSNYDELAKYDVMLFPTYWQGEGFPGVIIDAYIAGLPVISSDWNFNKEVIKDGETGWIIPTHDINSLADKMIYAIDHPEVVEQLAYNSRMLANKYDSRNVLSEEKLREIGLL